VSTARLFVSVTPPSDAVEHLGAVVDELEVSRANQPGHSTRLAARHRWHITVAFLGDVPMGRVDDAVEAVQAAVARVNLAPFPLCFAGGGTFGRGRLAILWCGVDGELASLRRLAEQVRRDLRKAGLPFDKKLLRPHLTISRPGARVPREQIAADVATLKAYRGPLWSVSDVQLMRSEMEQSPTGPAPRYTPLATIQLPATS
jgi:RNA 2',3'-cyclic 3'-phosphodiesterase